MVATRNHPRDFEPAPTESPTKRASRASTAVSPSPTSTVSTRSSTTAANVKAKQGTWTHTPSNLTLIWLAVSLPLVMWDTGYVLLRPHSMPGGWLHSPIWSPYKLYGEVDYVYGFKAYESKNGWTAAQGSFNAIETAAYLFYLYLVFAYGEQDTVQGRGAPEKEFMGPLKRLAESRVLSGRVAAVAILVAYSTCLVTFVKTLLYWLIEFFNGFESIGHNTWTRLVFLWIIPNGAWIVFPGYLLYVFYKEMLQGLEAAVETKQE